MSNALRVWRLTAILAVGANAFLYGCAAVPRTSVILLPDEDGHVGAVVVGNAAGAKQRIDQAYSAVVVSGVKTDSTSAMPRGKSAVDAAYEKLIKAQPTKPRTFVLHFKLDSVELTDDSTALLREIVRAAMDRKPTEITVYGHADSSGSEERNIRLSAERAQIVADYLRRSDPTLDKIQVQYFGDKEPLVPTEGRSPEPRNRRAEVVIL